MTNKSLSQRICEECGIKAIKGYIPTNCATVQQINIYPDFENPVNFKKLFNLKYGRASYETVIAKFCKCRFEIRSTTEFLEKFLNMLKYHKCWDTEQILKAIREENWEV